MSGTRPSDVLGDKAAQPSRRALPVLAALAFMALGVLMLVASWYLSQQRQRSQERSEVVRAELTRSVEGDRSAAAANASDVDIPLAATQLTDVETLLQVADQQSVRLGSLQFRSERVDKTPYLVRVVEFKLDEDYPRLKAFLSDLLVRFPHLYLDELRVDQAGDGSGKVQASLRLSFVYQTQASAASTQTSARSSP